MHSSVYKKGYLLPSGLQNPFIFSKDFLKKSKKIFSLKINSLVLFFIYLTLQLFQAISYYGLNFKYHFLQHDMILG